MTRCRSMQRLSHHGGVLAAFMGAGTLLMAWAGTGFSSEEASVMEPIVNLSDGLLGSISKMAMMAGVLGGALRFLAGRFGTAFFFFVTALFAGIAPEFLDINAQPSGETASKSSDWVWLVLPISLAFIGWSFLLMSKFFVSPESNQSAEDELLRHGEDGKDEVTLPPPLSEVASRRVESTPEVTAAGKAGDDEKPRPGKRKIILD